MTTAAPIHGRNSAGWTRCRNQSLSAHKFTRSGRLRRRRYLRGIAYSPFTGCRWWLPGHRHLAQPGPMNG
jgi:hypothetical protein